MPAEGTSQVRSGEEGLLLRITLAHEKGFTLVVVALVLMAEC